MPVLMKPWYLDASFGYTISEVVNLRNSLFWFILALRSCRGGCFKSSCYFIISHLWLTKTFNPRRLHVLVDTRTCGDYIVNTVRMQMVRIKLTKLDLKTKYSSL